MTPDAMTPAARRAATKQASPAATRQASPAATKQVSKAVRSPGHPRGLTRTATPRAPRRVSGPSGGRLAPPPPVAASPRVTANGAVAASAATIAVPAPALPRPRPARKPRTTAAPKPRIKRQRTPRTEPRTISAIAAVRALPNHRLLDRLVRGRAWIPVLGVLLAGIVAMQVENLKLGASMGRNLQLATQLQSRNELLRADVAALADDTRIERLATHLGMVMPGPTQVTFLPAGRGDAARAAASVHAPSPTTFESQLSSSGDMPGQGLVSPSSAASGAPSVASQANTAAAPAAAISTSTSTSSNGG